MQLSSVRSIEHCLAVCEQRTDCVSVTHQPQTSRCWLKNKPFGDRYSLLDGVNSANIPCIGGSFKLIHSFNFDDIRCLI